MILPNQEIYCMSSHIDFNETKTNGEIMSILLSGHTTNKNIMWCTSDYSKNGKSYLPDCEILIENITGNNQDITRPRISKFKSEKRQRSKDMAEVFTPSWICNKQNNLVDNDWFGYIGAFNDETEKWWITKDKVIFPENRMWKSYLAEPLSACTDSLIPVGKFSTKAEAESVLKYVKTKFLRFIVGILKVSQNIYQNVYKLVPMQDFSNKSDIDWSLPVSDIDKQLYKKYSLTEEETQYIEDIIKPMA